MAIGGLRHRVAQLVVLLTASTISLTAMTSCSTGSAKDHAVADLSSVVVEARDSFVGIMESSTPGQDLFDSIAMGIGEDLTTLSPDDDHVPQLPRGLIGLEEAGTSVLVEALFVARGNTGGLSNSNEYFFLCARLLGTRGSSEVAVEPLQCSEQTVQRLTQPPWTEVSLDDLPVNQQT